MADNKPAAAAAAAATAAAAAPKAKKGKGKLFVLIGIALALLLGGGAAAYMLVGKKAADADVAKKAEAKKQLPYFVEFDTFTANLRDTDRYLQIRMTFQVKTVDAAETIKDLMPIVRSAVIPVLGSQDSNELMTPEGKDKLAKEVVVAANKSLEGTPGGGGVDAVLFTHMIIQ